MQRRVGCPAVRPDEVVAEKHNNNGEHNNGNANNYKQAKQTQQAAQAKHQRNKNGHGKNSRVQNKLRCRSGAVRRNGTARSRCETGGIGRIRIDMVGSKTHHGDDSFLFGSFQVGIILILCAAKVKKNIDGVFHRVAQDEYEQIVPNAQKMTKQMENEKNEKIALDKSAFFS